MSTSRETDDQAIEALCFLLDLQRAGEPSGLASRSGLEGTRGELWSAILRRRLSNGPYTTKPASVASIRAQWRHRHYHVRRLAYPKEGKKKSAAYVAKKWNGREKSKTNAIRAKALAVTVAWINDAADRWQQPFSFDGGKRITIDYKALECAIARIAQEFPTNKKRKRDVV